MWCLLDARNLADDMTGNMAASPMLFVYGTLMSQARSVYGAAERARLDGASRVVGPAMIEGHLFDLGAFPGLVLKAPGGGTPSRIEGELRELVDPSAVFAWLDLYEGMGAADPLDDPYRRELREVLVAETGRVLPAWVYVYQGALEGARLLPVGRWSA